MKKLATIALLNGVILSSAFSMVTGKLSAPPMLKNLSSSEAMMSMNKNKDKKVFVSEEDAASLKDWYLQSPTSTKYQGVSSLEAIEKFGIGTNEVIVAVIDSGIDITHPALASKVWVNEKEANGKEGVDDDGNGYVDDVHGWNFLGDVYDARIEAVAVYMKIVQKVRDGYKLRKGDRFLLNKCLTAIYNFWGGETSPIAKAIIVNENIGYLLKEKLITKDKLEITSADLEALSDSAKARKRGVRHALYLIKKAIGEDDVQIHLNNYARFNARFGKYFNTYFNFDPAFTPFKDLDAQGENYGNGNVMPIGADEDHGTHVAGIIAGKSEEMTGVAGDAKVKIMSIRVVPNGDERDKDVANGIIYATDNGAKIINMSFGKGISSQTYLVKRAIRYAEARGVLIVHAAGNDAREITYFNNYPNKLVTRRKLASNFLTIGASSHTIGSALVADFSNFSKSQVDVFAPGYQIYSSVLNGGYDFFNGTSMASPVAAGVAALMLTHRPDLKPYQIIRVMRDTAKTYASDLKVILDTMEEPILFTKLSRSEGILDTNNIFEEILK